MYIEHIVYCFLLKLTSMSQPWQNEREGSNKTQASRALLEKIGSPVETASCLHGLKTVFNITPLMLPDSLGEQEATSSVPVNIYVTYRHLSSQISKIHVSLDICHCRRSWRLFLCLHRAHVKAWSHLWSHSYTMPDHKEKKSRPEWFPCKMYIVSQFF